MNISLLSYFFYGFTVYMLLKASESHFDIFHQMPVLNCFKVPKWGSECHFIFLVFILICYFNLYCVSYLNIFCKPPLSNMNNCAIFKLTYYYPVSNL